MFGIIFGSIALVVGLWDFYQVLLAKKENDYAKAAYYLIWALFIIDAAFSHLTKGYSISPRGRRYPPRRV